MDIAFGSSISAVPQPRHPPPSRRGRLGAPPEELLQQHPGDKHGEPRPLAVCTSSCCSCSSPAELC